MGLPSVSVVIPTFQRGSTLERTLEALTASDYPRELLEIIVVDDGSTDSTSEVLGRFAAVRSTRREHSGVCRARNSGAELASGEILMFLDDDIIVGPDNIRRHVEVRAEYAERAECIVSGKSEFPSEVRAALSSSPFGRFRLWVEDRSQARMSQQWGAQGRIEPLAVPTQNLSIGARFFRRLGGFDESFPSLGGEDQDLCLRARKAGAVVVLDYAIRVAHNDQHRDFIAICRREERGAVGNLCLARKHPDVIQLAALSVNGPLCQGDPPRLIVRKVVRGSLSQKIPLALAHRAVELTERLRPYGGWPLEDLYRATAGLYVFRGTRRALRLTSREPWDRALNDI